MSVEAFRSSTVAAPAATVEAFLSSTVAAPAATVEAFLSSTASAPAATAASSMLPSGWQEATDDETGATYYYHTSGQTSWQLPTNQPAAEETTAAGRTLLQRVQARSDELDALVTRLQAQDDGRKREEDARNARAEARVAAAKAEISDKQLMKPKERGALSDVPVSQQLRENDQLREAVAAAKQRNEIRRRQVATVSKKSEASTAARDAPVKRTPPVSDAATELRRLQAEFARAKNERFWLQQMQNGLEEALKARTEEETAAAEERAAKEEAAAPRRRRRRHPDEQQKGAAMSSGSRDA